MADGQREHHFGVAVNVDNIVPLDRSAHVAAVSSFGTGPENQREDICVVLLGTPWALFSTE